MGVFSSDEGALGKVGGPPPRGEVGPPGGGPPPWDPHLYARLGLPRRPEDYSNTGTEDHNTGPDDLNIRLNTKT